MGQEELLYISVRELFDQEVNYIVSIMKRKEASTLALRYGGKISTSPAFLPVQSGSYLLLDLFLHPRCRRI